MAPGAADPCSPGCTGIWRLCDASTSLEQHADIGRPITCCGRRAMEYRRECSVHCHVVHENLSGLSRSSQKACTLLSLRPTAATAVGPAEQRLPAMVQWLKQPSSARSVRVRAVEAWSVLLCLACRDQICSSTRTAGQMTAKVEPDYPLSAQQTVASLPPCSSSTPPVPCCMNPMPCRRAPPRSTVCCSNSWPDFRA